MTNVKLVFLGDGGVGKTCLMIRASTGEFPTGEVPKGKQFTANVTVEGREANLALSKKKTLSVIPPRHAYLVVPS